MKVLLLSITAGQGHNATAKAIGDYLMDMGIESVTLDTFSYLSKALGETVSKGYLLSVSRAKKPYAATYRLLENRKKNANELSATRVANIPFANKLQKFIDSYQPDVIVCTHIFSGILVDILKEEGAISAKTIGIVTDFTIHPFWEEALHFDYIVTATEFLDYPARKKGFRPEQILPFGIPIHPKFSHSVPKAEAREKLGLRQDLPVLMLMGGSMGYGHIDKTVSMLDSLGIAYQILVVCGNNAEAKEKVDALETENKVICFGFTDQVDLLMDASDAIITKPGGLTTSESLAKRLPMIIINPIPGQEDRNTEFLLNSGAAMAVSKSLPLDSLVYSLFTEKTRIATMLSAIENIRKPDSTATLCRFIQKIGSEEKGKTE